MIRLCYIVHMVSVGLMYSIANPVVIPVIMIAIGTMIVVERYNILFVFEFSANSDMSG